MFPILETVLITKFGEHVSLVSPLADVLSSGMACRSPP